MADERQLPLKCTFRIRLSVDAYDKFAPPSQELVNSHILNVATIRNIQPSILLCHFNAGHFPQ
jgi:hypothetical protein